MKKKIPLSIRKALEEITAMNSELIYPKIQHNDNDPVISLIEKDMSSDFYFNLEKINIDKNGKTSYLIEYKPSNPENLNHLRVGVNLDNFKVHFGKWKDFLSKFNEDSNLFEDAIVKKYYDELANEFEIVDEDLVNMPFGMQQQVKLIELLDSAKETINKAITPENESEGKQLIIEIEKTKAIVNKSTKKIVIDRIKMIIAKGWKFSLDVGKELLVSITAETIKRLGTGGMM